MLTPMTFALMLAAAPAAEPSPLPKKKVFSNLTKLPLAVLHGLPAPGSFDYDGDQQPDSLIFDVTKAGRLTLSMRLTAKGKTEVVFESKQSLTKWGATHFGMKIGGDPKTHVSVELWGVKGEKPLPMVSLDLKPATFTLAAEGQKRSWSDGSLR